MGHFRVYNASPGTVAKLKAKEFTKIQFSAGYQDSIATLFTGEIRQPLSGHESAVDSYVDIFAADSERSYNIATVNQSLAAGYTPRQKLQVALDAMAPYGVGLGLVNVDLDQPKSPRGGVFFSMARDIIRQVAFSKGAMWSTQMGQIHVVDHNKPIPANTIVMSAATGMIGYPTQTADGIIVTSLINPRLQPHVNLQIDPSVIQQAQADNNPFSKSALTSNQILEQQNAMAGLYNVFKVNRHGDTRGNDWFDQSWCIGVGGSLPPSQRSERYFLGTS